MSTCSVCGEVLEPGNTVLIQGKRKNDPPEAVCSGCAETTERALEAEATEVSIFGGALGGIAGALLSAIIWYLVVVMTRLQIGYIAIAFGWIVAQGVIFGAGGKRGPALQMISLVFTLAGLVTSEYFISMFLFNDFLVEAGVSELTLPTLLPVGDMVLFLFDNIAANPITLFFWAIALLEAFIIPRKRQLQRIQA